MSSYSGTTAVSGVDARIADLEAEIRQLKERLEPELRPTKSMPLLRRLRRKDDRGTKEFIALVETKRSGKAVREKEGRADKERRGSALGAAGKSVIDLSHLVCRGH
jgi:hypothetical protein